MSITLSFIGGEPVASRDLYDNIDPATGRSIGAVARGGADEIDHAVTAARVDVGPHAVERAHSRGVRDVAIEARLGDAGVATSAPSATMADSSTAPEGVAALCLGAVVLEALVVEVGTEP